MGLEPPPDPEADQAIEAASHWAAPSDQDDFVFLAHAVGEVGRRSYAYWPTYACVSQIFRGDQYVSKLWIEVIESLIKAFSNGELRSFRKSGEHFISIPADWWETPEADAAFTAWSHPSGGWLFADKASLDAFTGRDKLGDKVAALLGKLQALPLWELRETLLWLALKDAEAVAKAVVVWQFEQPSLFASTCVDWFKHVQARLTPLKVDVGKQLIADSLLEALRNGTIIAKGIPPGQASFRPVEATDWLALQLYPGDPGMGEGQVIALSPRSRSMVWSNIHFRLPISASCTPIEKADWELRAGELQKTWVSRAEVQEEARRRAVAAGNGTGPSALDQAMSSMVPPGVNWSPQSIGATRRKT